LRPQTDFQASRLVKLAHDYGVEAENELWFRVLDPEAPHGKIYSYELASGPECVDRLFGKVAKVYPDAFIGATDRQDETQVVIDPEHPKSVAEIKRDIAAGRDIAKGGVARRQRVQSSAEFVAEFLSRQKSPTQPKDPPQPQPQATNGSTERFLSFICNRYQQAPPGDEKLEEEPRAGEEQAKAESAAPLDVFDAGDDVDLPPPRAWLLGNSFARKFLSSLFADGGVGKTALRYAQLIALATEKAITGEHVFQRCRVLIVSLEDDRDELQRRVEAVLRHYKIDRSETKGWLFYATPGAAAGKLMMSGKFGTLIRGKLAASIEAVVAARGIDIVSIDPFVKSHSVEENSNSAIDDVVQILTDLMTKYNIAVDVPHHVARRQTIPATPTGEEAPAP
jgi:hypothetical protein